MSKYDALWAYIQGRNEETLVLSFADIAQIFRYTVGATP